MFKVMCIANRDGWLDKVPHNVSKSYLWGLFKKTETIRDRQNGPDYGETCTVVDVYTFQKEDYYALKEYPFNNRNEYTSFHSQNFIRLSKIDEMELHEEKLKDGAKPE